MKLGDLLRETLSVDCDEVWENERTPTPVRVFGVRLHSMRPSLREVVAVFEWLDVDRLHGAVWNWTHALSESQADPPTAEPSRVAVDEKQIEVDGEKKWLYAAIDTDTKLLLDVEEFGVEYHPNYLAGFLKKLGLSKAIPRTQRPSQPENAEEILEERGRRVRQGRRQRTTQQTRR